MNRLRASEKRGKAGSVFIFLIFLSSAGLLVGNTTGDAAPPEGKGKEESAPGQARGQEQTPPGQQDRTPPAQADRTPPGQDRAEQAQNRAADAVANRSERATEAASNRAERAADRGNNAAASADRQEQPQERRALDKADRDTGAREERGSDRAADHRRDPEERGRQLAQVRVDNLLKAMNKFEHARWDSNPHDTRGQGNMGKVDMRDPYGFDKDSGREKSERGRPIRPEEPVLDLTALVTINWQLIDLELQFLYSQLNAWRDGLNDPHWSQFAWYVNYVNYYINYWQTRIANYTPPPYVKIPTNWDLPIEYTMTVGTQEGFEGTNLIISTTLTSINDYTETFSFVDWSRRAEPGETNYYGWPIVTITYHFDAGQVAVTSTEEVTLGEDGTYAFSYEPVDTYYTPDTLVGGAGNYFELAVTVTEPVSGASYTITYDRPLYLYRCPYGIVYDKVTGRAVVGATVTVHNADGSIVLLDKAANPNVSNPQTTDATGRYNAKLAIGQKYYLSVKAPGYEEYRSSLFSERWHIVREDVALTPVKDAADTTANPAPELLVPVGAERPPTAVGISSGFIPGK